MEMNFEKYTVEELRELQNKIGRYLQSLNDGFVYICEVRSYGRNWKETFSNEIAVNELCEKYDGYDGIVDVYTTNPNAKIQNFGGSVSFVKSEEELEKWKSYKDLIHSIKNAEQKIKDWKDKDNVPFHSRPSFPPIWTEEEVAEMKIELEKISEHEPPLPLEKN